MSRFNTGVVSSYRRESNVLTRSDSRKSGDYAGSSGGYTGKLKDFIPERKQWEYRKEGPALEERFAGQPCLECNKCNGFQEHSWRKSCKECKCARDLHVVVTEQGARARMGLAAIEDEERTREYTWTPPGLDEKQIGRYFSCLSDEDIPRVNTPGEQKRKQRLVLQLPKQDLAPNGCRHLKPDQISSYNEFIRGRNEIALDVGVVQFPGAKAQCSGCDKPILAKQPAVLASRIPQALWHPQCFRCGDCRDLLVDLAYCEQHNKPYCVRHYSDRMKPRCNSCDEEPEPSDPLHELMDTPKNK